MASRVTLRVARWSTAALFVFVVAAVDARGATLEVDARSLQAVLQLDPWHLEFHDTTNGEVLESSAAATPNLPGSVGFRTASGWFQATRASEAQQRATGEAIVAIVETTDPDRPRLV